VSSGDYLLRLSAEKLAEVHKAALSEGVTLSAWLREAVDAKLAGGDLPRPASRQDVLREVADVAGKLRAGFVLVPCAEVPGSSWSDVLEHGGPGSD
jgi:hypothetical protein